MELIYINKVTVCNLLDYKMPYFCVIITQVLFQISNTRGKQQPTQSPNFVSQLPKINANTNGATLPVSQLKQGGALASVQF